MSQWAGGVPHGVTLLAHSSRHMCGLHGSLPTRGKPVLVTMATPESSWAHRLRSVPHICEGRRGVARSSSALSLLPCTGGAASAKRLRLGESGARHRKRREGARGRKAPNASGQAQQWRVASGQSKARVRDAQGAQKHAAAQRSACSARAPRACSMQHAACLGE